MIKVFIVEDDPMVLEVNSGFLSRIPSFILSGTADNGASALRGIEELEPHLVLLDMYLPDISGFEVLKRIRERNLSCDVIMITAARDTATIHEVFRYGAVDYIVKPFRFERFRSALESYLKMWKKLQSTTLKQEDIDEWKQIQASKEELPKGLSESTMRQILLALIEEPEPVTSDTLSQKLGMARVTVRRYLEYLEQSGKIKVQSQYGTVGRPSNFYSM